MMCWFVSNFIPSLFASCMAYDSVRCEVYARTEENLTLCQNRYLLTVRILKFYKLMINFH